MPLQVNCIRVPVVEEGAPAESCFDIMLESLKDEPASTQCVFSCQMGRGRTTLGMVVACLIKEIQVGLNGSIAEEVPGSDKVPTLPRSAPSSRS